MMAGTESKAIDDIAEIWQLAFRVARSSGGKSNSEDIAQVVALEANKLLERKQYVTHGWVKMKAQFFTRQGWVKENLLHEAEATYNELREEEHEARCRGARCWSRYHPYFGLLVREVRALMLLLQETTQDVIATLYLYGYTVHEARARLHMGLERMNWIRRQGILKLRLLAEMGDSND